MANTTQLRVVTASEGVPALPHKKVTKTCIFHKKNQCRAGNKCPFVHLKDDRSPSPESKTNKGKCKIPQAGALSKASLRETSSEISRIAK